GGLWLRSGEDELHLGVEDDFRPARKAHPAFVVADLDAVARRLTAAGAEPAFDDAIAGVRRFYVADAVGNRLEFMEEGGQ
ncbi:MAG TPA: glyoxalase, partial [Devosia sp.]|nr:glyoxalase [Devosia sp.]